MSEIQAPETPKRQDDAAEQVAEAAKASAVFEQVSASAVVPSSGTRAAFREIGRQLSEADLASRGVQKLILEELERAEAQCGALQGYVDRYYEAHERAAVLQERMEGTPIFRPAGPQFRAA
jgi:hypothetical protein